MAKKLAIAGKVIDISKIGEKSQAQFAAQLKMVGVVLPEARLAELYTQLHDGAVTEKKVATMSDEEREAFYAQMKAASEESN